MRPELINSLKGYNRTKFLADIMSGIMVAIIALPLSIALGIQSGATLQQGLITAIVAGFFISVLGGCKYQIGGPSASFMVIIVGYVANPEIGMFGLQIATVMAGIILLVMGLSRVGGLIKFIPYPIVIAFTTGIGVTMLLGQMKDFLALKIPTAPNDFIGRLIVYAKHINTINFPTLLLGIFTLAILILLPRLKRKIPAAFTAILFATIVSVILGVIDKNRFGIATIGSTFGKVTAEINFFDFSKLLGFNYSKVIMPAFIIAFLASIEGLLSATVSDGITDTKHDSNQELIGQGVANMASALCGGLPATGAIARTVANIKNGAASPVSGIIHSVLLLIMFFLLMPVMQFIPMAALSAVLIMVSVSMSNFPLFIKLMRFNIKDTLILLTTFVLTVIFDLSYGVIGGLVLTIILMFLDVIKRTKIEQIFDISVYNESGEFTIESYLGYRIIGALSFKNADALVRKCLKNLGETETLLLDMANVKSVDVSAVEKLLKMKIKFVRMGKRVLYLNQNDKVSKQLNKGERLLYKK